MLENARDYSREANKAFNAPVPAGLMDYLQANKKALHPQMLEKWGSQGYKKQGNWQEVFGADLYTDEIFMAWHYAKFVERLAQTARSIYNVPLYVNAAMNSRGRKPGEYPSAGPLAHLIEHSADGVELVLIDKALKEKVGRELNRYLPYSLRTAFVLFPNVLQVLARYQDQIVVAYHFG